jgi:DNA-binding PadR family transcriptional regulator
MAGVCRRSRAEAILLALTEGEKHGYALLGDMERLSDGAVKVGAGTLYGSIKRMLADGLIQESDGRPDPALDDQRRRYHRLTGLGERVADAEQRRLAALLQRRHRAGHPPGDPVRARGGYLPPPAPQLRDPTPGTLVSAAPCRDRAGRWRLPRWGGLLVDSRDHQRPVPHLRQHRLPARGPARAGRDGHGPWPTLASDPPSRTSRRARHFGPRPEGSPKPKTPQPPGGS